MENQIYMFLSQDIVFKINSIWQIQNIHVTSVSEAWHYLFIFEYIVLDKTQAYKHNI